MHGFEAILFFFAFYILCFPFSIHMVYAYVLLAFLLLRYHLFVNDLSMVTKTLSRQQLEQLMLTRFGVNEYFLHQFLIFCQSYRLIYGYFGLLMMFIVMNWTGLIVMFILVMQVWLAGVYQFVLEWKYFAGGHWSRWRDVVSIGISIALSVLICGFDLFGAHALLVNFTADAVVVFGLIPFFFALSWAGACLWVLSEARGINANATAILRNRLDPAFDDSPYRLRPLDMILPSRWATPFDNARQHPGASLPTLGNLSISLLYAALFASLLFGMTYASRDWLIWNRFVKCTAASAFMLFTVGMIRGQTIAVAIRPIAGLHMRRVFGWLGMLSMLAAIAVFAYDTGEHQKIEMENILVYYIVNCSICLAALACGVLFQQHQELSMMNRILLIGGLAFFFSSFGNLAINIIGRIVHSRDTATLLAHGFIYLIVFFPARLALEPLWTKREK